MASSNPSQLFLLADHVKLSLLERQRAITMNLDPGAQDGHISRSLDSLNSGIQAIENQLVETPDSNLSEQVTNLRTQYDTMLSQSQGADKSTTATSPTLTSPNNSTLIPTFAAAQSSPPHTRAAAASKSVRFKDNPSRSPSPPHASRNALFSSQQQPYRDEPYDDDGALPDQSDLSNEQIHAYHSRVLREQDDQLDELSSSIGRQRELSLAMGDELDDQAVLLDGVDEATDRHQGQLDRAQTRLGKVAKRARENWGMTIIAILIIILVLLIIILK